MDDILIFTKNGIKKASPALLRKLQYKFGCLYLNPSLKHKSNSVHTANTEK